MTTDQLSAQQSQQGLCKVEVGSMNCIQALLGLGSKKHVLTDVCKQPKQLYKQAARKQPSCNEGAKS